MRAYPYDVEIVLSNKNDPHASRVETRRVHAYSASDAAMQAIFAVSATAGSADLKITRVAPPPEACAPLEELLGT